jgi:hypothetical protein
VIGCGGDEGSGSEITPTVALTSVPLGQAALEEGVARLAEGTFTTTLQAGAVSGFDPQKLPLEGTNEVPPCAALVFAFAWQVTQPVPADDTGLVWRLTEMGVPTEVGSGPVGTATIGCGFIEPVNTGDEAIIVNVHYLIGRRTE